MAARKHEFVVGCRIRWAPAVHGLLFAMWHDIQFQFYACPARASLSGLDASGTGSKSAIKYDYGQFELTLWVRRVEAAKKMQEAKRV